MRFGLGAALQLTGSDQTVWHMPSQHMRMMIHTQAYIYAYVVSKVKISNRCSKEFRVQVGVPQGSVLSLLLVHSWSCKQWQRNLRWAVLLCCWSCSYNSLTELEKKLQEWKRVLEPENLRVNLAKTASVAMLVARVPIVASTGLLWPFGPLVETHSEALDGLSTRHKDNLAWVHEWSCAVRDNILGW